MEQLKKISKNCYKGEPIKEAGELVELANNAESVYHINWGRKAAAIIVCMQFRIVMNEISKASLFRVINTTKTPIK